MVFFDSNSTLVHLALNKQINELKKETEYYKNEIEKELNNMFGNRWKPVFKQWFEDKFNLPVTTVY